MGESMSIQIPMQAKGAWNKDTIISMNTLKKGGVFRAQTITELQGRQGTSEERRGRAGNAASNERSSMPGQMSVPPLVRPISKGQKVVLSLTGSASLVDVRLGWNRTDSRCDVDVSVFLLGENGKVIGDDWFVFYGQTKSPDGSTVFEMDGVQDREVIRLDLDRLNTAVKKIVFVLTINEAFEKKLHFGMLKDAYIRILNHKDQNELVSFSMTDYYTNVISMMIGELYLHNGSWKFHGIGNGVAKDLAGLCGLYGVQVS